jgi:dihydrofolate synthase/folylpolyglutamate synthase
VIVAGMLQDKPPASFLAPLAGVADHWLVTELASPRTMPAAVLEDALRGLDQRVGQAASVATALDAAIAAGAPLVVVTGSLTTVAEARVALGLATNDPAPI